jgi:hypothetical protein
MTALIILTSAGTLTGPFNLYSDVEGYLVSFASGISRAQLLAGYASDRIPEGTSIVRIVSVGSCYNYIDVAFPDNTTTTTTSSSTSTTTTTSSSTTTTTTTRLPDVCRSVISFDYRGSVDTTTMTADYILCQTETPAITVFTGLTPDPVTWTTYNVSTMFPTGLCILDGSFDRISGCEIQNVVYSTEPCVPYVPICTLAGTAVITVPPTTTTTTTLSGYTSWHFSPLGRATGALACLDVTFSNVWYTSKQFGTTPAMGSVLYTTPFLTAEVNGGDLWFNLETTLPDIPTSYKISSLGVMAESHTCA